ncbi:MAG TPA: response regulator [Candidatus Binatia bacterium]|nr:response regulator [Candidatus Binatia bacterium]
MARILAIDDDENTCALVEAALGKRGYDVRTAMSGIAGLKKLQEFEPNALIIDKMMPGMDGYELVQRIRKDPKWSHIPILILTAEADLEGKVHAFDVGADDYLNKPFAPEELTARIAALIRRSNVSNGSGPGYKGGGKTPRIIAVHSLRGGIGSTTLAVNLAVALRDLWRAPTLLVDLVLLSGHVNLFLDRRVLHSWASLHGYALEDIDDQLLESLVQDYENGLQFVAAPDTPSEAELVTRDAVAQALRILKPSYDYIVVDLPHDFGDMTLEILDQADVILSLVAPELAALRAAAMTIDTYNKLEYDLGSVQLVLNRPFAEQGVATMDIYRALKHSIAVELPYAGTRCVQAINNGQPLVSARPDHEMSRAIENYAFDISKSSHTEFPPIAPTEAWRRVQESRNPSKLLRRVGRIFQ